MRQYCAFAGIKHGHNAREFLARLVERRVATPYAALHARARLYHIHHRRLYAAIGEPQSRFREPLPVGRAMGRLMMLDAVLDQPGIPWLATEHVRSDRTRAGMKAALELGRWVFLAPLGYMNAPRMLSKSLMPDPDRAPLVRRAFEEYATGQFTKQQMLQQVTAWGLRNRRGQSLSSQAIGMLLRNQLYAGIVDVAKYGVRGRGGDFEPLVSEDTFYRVQAVLSGRTPSLAQRRSRDRSRPSPEVSLCEGAAGSGLQVLLERHRARRVAELHDDIDHPRLVPGGVRHAPGIVGIEPSREVGCEARVVADRV